MKGKKENKEKHNDIPEDVKKALDNSKGLLDVDDINEQESDSENIEEIIKTWLSDKFIHAKTRLNSNQIIALTILKTLSEKYQVKCIKELLDNFVRYKLSEGGKSSEELVDILKNRNNMDEDEELEKAIRPFLN